jgi:hypothetical protein
MADKETLGAITNNIGAVIGYRRRW